MKAIINAHGSRAAEALENLLAARLVIDGSVVGTSVEVDCIDRNTDDRLESFGLTVASVAEPFAHQGVV